MTIMLNWIVVLGRLYLFGSGRAAPEHDVSASPTSKDVAESAQAPRLLGHPRPPGSCTSACSSASRRSSPTGSSQPDDARLRGAGRRVQPRGSPLRRHLRRAELLPRDGDRRRLRGRCRRDRHARLAIPSRLQRHLILDDRVPRHRRRAARPKHGDRHGSFSARLRRLAHRHAQRNITREVFNPEQAGNLTSTSRGSSCCSSAPTS